MLYFFLAIYCSWAFGVVSRLIGSQESSEGRNKTRRRGRIGLVCDCPEGKVKLTIVYDNCEISESET